MRDDLDRNYKPTILVVDDTPQNLQLMCDLLIPHYVVKVASSGARALKTAAANPPDLIVLDIMMPDMDGYEVCRALKADPACREVPIIFLTSNDDTENEEAGLALGAVDYLTKPFSPVIVLARVRNQLALSRSRARTQELLHSILPVDIARELSETGKVRPVRHEAVTILFTDFSKFTQSSSTMPADRMLAELNDIFGAFDEICEQTGIEKIKTIGDAFMAAAGLPRPCEDHAQRCVKAGLRMIDYLNERNNDSAFKWNLRVGIHTGSVVAGIVGTRKYAFDIWGDAVNVASRIESAGEIGRVNISAYTYDLIRGDYACEYRGKIDAKNKGPIDMYFVSRAFEQNTA